MNTRSLPPAAGWGPVLAAGVAAGALLLLLLRNALGHVPLYDELLHFFAARSLVHGEGPAIADGLYTRALLYTQLVALAMRAAGETLVAARLPALLAGATLALLLTVCVARRAGLVAGFASGVMLILLPETQRLAVFARFYTLHALVVVAIAFLALEASRWHGGNARRGLLLVLLLVALALGWHLQESTALAAAAVGSGALAVVIHDRWNTVRPILQRHPLAIACGTLLLVLLGVLAVWQLGLWARLSSVPLWAAGNAFRPQYYLVAFADDMPLLWPLLPFAALVAWQRHPRLVLFFATALAVGLVLHSIAAAKASRYAYYLLPFACVLWGCAVADAIHWVRARTAPRHAALIVVAAMLPLLVLSREGQRAARLAAGKTLAIEEMGYNGEPDWAVVLPALRDTLGSADRVITSNAMKALYYLGRYDFDLNASIVLETDTAWSSAWTNVPGAARSARANRWPACWRCRVPRSWSSRTRSWGSPRVCRRKAVARIEASCQRLTLPPDSGVSAWRCARPAS